MDREIVELAAQPCAVVRGEVAVADLPGFFSRAYPLLMEELGRQGVAPVGPPFAFYPSMPTEVVEVLAGVPVAGPVDPAGDVVPFELPGGRAVSALHVGPYEALEQTYTELMAWMAGEGLTPAGHMWEIYLSDPSEEPDPATWRTQIVWPLAPAAT